MFPTFHHPDNLHGVALDKYLEKGWFRAGQYIYTIQHLLLDGAIYSPIRVRLALKGYQFRKGLRKLIKKNQIFQTDFQASVITDEKEILYHHHIQRLEGFVSPTLRDSLMDGGLNNIYDTYEVQVYDEDQLIATSFFDLGEKTMASINGIFHNDYEKYSLGFYTMLMEIKFGIENDFEYYYPGYVIPGYPKFDYKLRIGEVEFYDANKDIWYTIEELKDTEMFETVIEQIAYYKGKYY